MAGTSVASFSIQTHYIQVGKRRPSG